MRCAGMRGEDREKRAWRECKEACVKNEVVGVSSRYED